jgi:heavy metal translocating P-type ATPase
LTHLNDGVAKAVYADNGYRVLHCTGRRLRLAIPEGFGAHQALENWLIQQANIEAVRLNSIAGSCVLQLAAKSKPWDTADISQWLAQLPGSHIAAEAALTALPKQVKAIGKGSEASSGAADEEAFVPSRLLLPASSLALALLAGPLSLPPLAVAGFILVAAHLSFKRAWIGLREEGMINVDFLDSLAVTLHSLGGFLVGPAMMISMIEGGEAVRDATQRIAHSANNDLLASLQTDVIKLINGAEVLVQSSELETGDQVLLFPGDNIPVDGVIISGEGSFDVVKLTGESVPRYGSAGDEVLAGFILLEGKIVIETKAVGSDTRIGQITSMIESAPVYDTRVGNFAAKIANRFVIPTLLLAGVSLLVSAGNIAQAASLLMFDLGTGLRVSVPTAIMAALSRASSQGLLIRSGRSLELLVDVDVVVFDKTGTLTQGHPSVVQMDVLHPELDAKRLCWLATTAEQGLNHPVATAIVNYAQSLGLEPGQCDGWDYRIGKGVIAVIEGQQVLIGNAKILQDEGLSPPALNPEPSLRASTPIYLALDGAVAAVFYAADQLRPDSKQLIAELHRRGIQAHMLTGDVASVANAVAADLGLQPNEVHADALPDQKAELVKKLSEQGHNVAFVGDGINDSAALAYANVSVSFASGSDLARETADIVLTNDKVSGLIVAQDLARRTFALVRQNIGIVGVPNLSALVIGTFLPISPIAAVLLNNGSCLVAAANAMRSLGFKPSELLPIGEASPKSNPIKGEDIAPDKIYSKAELPRQTADQASCSPSPPLELTSIDLARRLRSNYQTVIARRCSGGLEQWTRERDPDGLAWIFISSNNTYRPLALA